MPVQSHVQRVVTKDLLFDGESVRAVHPKAAMGAAQRDYAVGCICMCTCMYDVCTCVGVSVCIYVSLQWVVVCLDLCGRVHVWVNVCMSVYICVYVFVCVCLGCVLPKIYETHQFSLTSQEIMEPLRRYTKTSFGVNIIVLLAPFSCHASISVFLSLFVLLYLFDSHSLSHNNDVFDGVSVCVRVIVWVRCCASVYLYVCLFFVLSQLVSRYLLPILSFCFFLVLLWHLCTVTNNENPITNDCHYKHTQPYINTIPFAKVISSVTIDCMSLRIPFVRYHSVWKHECVTVHVYEYFSFSVRVRVGACVCVQECECELWFSWNKCPKLPVCVRIESSVYVDMYLSLLVYFKCVFIFGSVSIFVSCVPHFFWRNFNPNITNRWHQEQQRKRRTSRKRKRERDTERQMSGNSDW